LEIYYKQNPTIVKTDQDAHLTTKKTDNLSVDTQKHRRHDLRFTFSML